MPKKKKVVTHGGRRDGAGRKQKPGARIKTSFTLDPAVDQFLRARTSDTKSISDVVNEIVSGHPEFAQ